MTSDSLNLKAFDPDDFSGIFILVFIGQEIALCVLVVTGKSFQSILIIGVERNDYIPFGSRAITLYHQQIAFSRLTSRSVFRQVGVSCLVMYFFRV